MKYIWMTAFLSLILSGCKETVEPNYEAVLAAQAASNIGRYQLIQLGTFRRDQYLLDTATGKIWTSVCASSSKNGVDCNYSYWATSDVENLGISIDEIIAKENFFRKSK